MDLEAYWVLKEADRIGEAFKNPEFLKLFEQYAADISSPEALAEQDAYLRQIEQEGRAEELYGKDMELIVPKPCFVCKARTTSGKKVFINVCSNSKIERVVETHVSTDSKQGRMCDIPFAMGRLHETHDKQGQLSHVVDFVVHEETTQRALQSTPFYSIMMETAIDQLNALHGLCLERTAIQLRSVYKGRYGSSRPSVLSIKKATSRIQGSSNSKPTSGQISTSPATDPIKVPAHRVSYVYDADLSSAWKDVGRNLPDSTASRPRGIRIEIELPGVQSSKEIDLDITAARLQLTVKEQYDLKMDLPFEVEASKGQARFLREQTTLEITLLMTTNRQTELPILAPTTEQLENDFSIAVESDQGTESEESVQDEILEPEPLPPKDHTILTANEKQWNELHTRAIPEQPSPQPSAEPQDRGEGISKPVVKTSIKEIRDLLSID